ncbi:hypothetical protein GJ744_009878 [Endocarpon pusillum]|uniref:Uncharacterized protein n=1 Tax=Endocarpon pusillum TaxID=364733 RepID=A0A8H7AJ43_9EURO|nr:hypothetical protein GJ744_009878 [Endocarpon pusillum]
MPQPDDSSVLVACYPLNATYIVDFSFQNSQQGIDIRSVTIQEATPSNATVDTEDTDYSNIVYSSVLYAFNNIAIATATNDTGTEAPNPLYYGGPVSVWTLRVFIEAKESTNLNADAVINTLQDIFQNVTLSTMASASLRLPDAQAIAIETKAWHSVNAYVYEPISTSTSRMAAPSLLVASAFSGDCRSCCAATASPTASVSRQFCGQRDGARSMGSWM